MPTADPNATPFYAAMAFASKPTEQPTWTVQMYRFTVVRSSTMQAVRCLSAGAHAQAARIIGELPSP